MPEIRVRFAPSPTGTLHTGSARTALFNYLYAKQKGGQFILRIDDTDKERSTTAYEQDILAGLDWLGLRHDEIYYQSARTAIYRQELEKLLAQDKIYEAEDKVLRFRNPNQPLKFTDLIRGEIEFDTTDLGDFVVAKNLETPLYHFASVVDDHELDISHVIRGEDHISNTPRQILLGEAIGARRPVFAHLPLILAPDRSKLSKRKHAAIASLNALIEEGYLPEALINFLAFLGWNPGGERELFALAELIELFDLSKVQSSAAIFNPEKLAWYNREYLKNLSDERWLEEIKKYLPAERLLWAEKLLPELRNRLATFGELKTLLANGDFDFVWQAPAANRELLKNPVHLPAVSKRLEALAEKDWTIDSIKKAIWDFATEQGRGEVLWPMRVALTGRKQSPDPFTVAAILGQAETLKRLSDAQSW